MTRTAEGKKEYTRGYVAGRKKFASDQRTALLDASEVSFWEKSFSIASKYFLGCTAWKRGDKVLSSFEDRLALTVKFANKAVEERRSNVLRK